MQTSESSSPAGRLRVRRSAFVFPGAGVPLCGQEEAFFLRHQAVIEPFLAEASESAGVDLRHGLRPAQAAELDERACQLLTYAFDCAVAEVWRRLGFYPSVVAGHSLGLYAALVAAEALSFTDGLPLVAQAHALVTEACAGRRSGMAVVVGLTAAEADGWVNRLPDSSLCRVNANNAATQIFAGPEEDLLKFLELLQPAAPLVARLLPVGAPYHHAQLLAEVPGRFEPLLRRASWSRARCPVVSSIDQTLLVEPEDLLQLTARNVATPISWEGVMNRLVSSGLEALFECGPGISLSQNGRFIEGCPPMVNVKNAWRRAGA